MAARLIFVASEVKKIGEKAVKLDFYNHQLGMSKSLIYIRGDQKYAEDINLGITTLLIGVGFVFLFRGLSKKSRITKLKKQIEGLKMLKYAPANRNTKQIVENLQKNVLI